MRALSLSIVLALTGCPWVGEQTYRQQVQDLDGDGELAERFGGRDCQDANGAISNCDQDGDGFLSLAAGGDDCDDTSAAIHPDAVERCDGVDNNCDGLIDNDDPAVVSDRPLWVDADGDGDGDPDRPIACQELADPADPSSGIHAANPDDCDDDDPSIGTDAAELCDGVDNNCDGIVDDVGLWFRDDDGDGFGVSGTQVSGACDIGAASGLAAVAGDCDDTDSGAFPGAPEIPYDGIDQDCDGNLLEDWDQDYDGHVPDAHFAAAQAADQLNPPDQRWGLSGGDCDDLDARRYAGNPEVCDGVDNDCDDLVDEQDLAQAAPTDEPLLRSQLTQVWLDLDGDGHGGTPHLICPVNLTAGVHYLTATDCFDDPEAPPMGYELLDAATVFAGAEERCDGIDNSCDGQTDWADVAFPGSGAYFIDVDGDGFGVEAVFACPSTTALPLADRGGDCDDADAARYPDAPEICGNPVREDCAVASPWDCDLDGFEGDYFGNGSGEDCLDTDATVHPDADEVCDGRDNDCDGLTDSEDPSVDTGDLPLWYPDADLDGWGDATVPGLEQCDAPGPGFSILVPDCDDTDPDALPGAPWYLDADGDGWGVTATRTEVEGCQPPPASPGGTWVLLDGDCNDEDPTYEPDTLWWLDADGDGVGDPAQAIRSCTRPSPGTWALATAGADCNDDDPSALTGRTWYADADGDGYGDPDESVESCLPPLDGRVWVPLGADCDDDDPTIHPARAELCNGVDDDCDGFVDDQDPNVMAPVGSPIGYRDADGDGFGDDDVLRAFCYALPSGWIAIGGDCDDGDAAVRPGALEICGNGIDDDCSGDETEPVWFADLDGDGFGVGPATAPSCDPPASTGWASSEGDCDDSDDARFPGAVERDACDGVDDDCDGTPEPRLTWTFDADRDGYGDDATAIDACSSPTQPPPGATAGAWVLRGGDCDDGDASITFGRVFYADADRDGYGNADSSQFACPRYDDDGHALPVWLDADGDGLLGADELLLSTLAGDCDDQSPAIGLARTWYVDEDQDGWGSTLRSPVVACPAPGNVAPAGLASRVGDCVDRVEDLNDPDAPDAPSPSSIFPGATELLGDGEDNDCDGFIDDENATVRWYEDLDGDGFGGSLVGAWAPGLVPNGTDCDDSDASRHPAHPEICDGIVDNDCDGVLLGDPDVDNDGDGLSVCDGDPDDTDDAITPYLYRWFLDGDGDGYGGGTTQLAATPPGDAWTLTGGDCDDGDDTIAPGVGDATCDGVDDDCDGLVDEDAPTQVYYPDTDGDGEGDHNAAFVRSCAAPAGYATNAHDCDDADPDVNTAGVEACDGVDSDCDGLVELDRDGDGFFDCEDCDDLNPRRFPGNPEVCDGVLDNDCDGDFAGDIEVDGDGDGYSVCQGDADDTDPGDAPLAFLWYFDGDGDGFGAGVGQLASSAPGGDWVRAFGDCDDSDAEVRPGVVDDDCDGVDDDCDGVPDDDADPASLLLYFPDVDGDGHGRQGAVGQFACVIPSGHAATDDDCDDLDPQTFPGAPERCDGRDNDCDSLVPDDELDLDGDGWPSCEGDCDDTEPAQHPAHPELCDGIEDNDCDGVDTIETLDADGDGFSVCQGDPDDDDDDALPLVLTWYVDGDGDGVGAGAGVPSATRPAGHVLQSGDCDDDDPTIRPGVADVGCDAIDDDCDGLVDEDSDDADKATFYLDADYDGHGRSAMWVRACTAPFGFVAFDDDCDDDDPDTYPGATERCDGLDNDCDTLVPAGELDSDGDGWRGCEGDCDDDEASRHPAHPELCDGIEDNDCDGVDTIETLDADGDGFSVCEGDPDDGDAGVGPLRFAWYPDADGDGYGANGPAVFAVAPPPGHVNADGDCDDGDPDVHPGRPDATCDGVDDNCNGLIDEHTPDDELLVFYLDADGDGFGVASDPVTACQAPAGYVPDVGDCDDGNADTYPGADELCDGLDNDCDSNVPADEVDGDGDGWRVCANDCDDADPDTNPGVPVERCDGVDNDCDGAVANLPDGPSYDVPNPTRGTTVAGDESVYVADADRDGAFSMRHLGQLCEEFAADVVVTYPDQDPITLRLIEDADELLLALDCDDGTANAGLLGLLDLDDDGVAASPEGVDEVALLGCGDDDPPGFIPWLLDDPIDCDPGDPDRAFELEDGVYYDLDGDGWVSALPYAAGPDQDSCGGFVFAHTVPGPDCNDREYSSAPEIAFEPVDIESNAALDAALAACKEATLRVDTTFVSWDSPAATPQVGARLTLTAREPELCADPWSTYGCLGGSGPLEVHANVDELTLRDIGLTIDIEHLVGAGQLALERVYLAGTLRSENKVVVQDLTIQPFGATTAITIDGIGGSLRGGPLLALGDGTTSALLSTTSGQRVELSDASFSGAQTAIDLVDGDLACERCSFDFVDVGVRATRTNTLVSPLEVACADCAFTDIAVAGLDVGDQTSTTCSDCTLEGMTAGVLVDLEPPGGLPPGELVLDGATFQGDGGFSSDPVLRLGAGAVVLDGVSMLGTTRPLAHASGAVTVRDLHAHSHSGAGLALLRIDGGSLFVDGADLRAVDVPLVRAFAGDVTLRDVSLRNTSTLIDFDTTQAATLTVDGFDAHGTALTNERLVRLRGAALSASLRDVSVRDYEGWALEAVDGAAVELREADLLRVDRLANLEYSFLDARDVIARGATTSNAGFITLYGADAVIRDSRFLDLAHGSQAAIQVAEPFMATGAPSLLTMRHSLVWSIGTTPPLVVDGGAVDLLETTLYNDGPYAWLALNRPTDTAYLRGALLYEPSTPPAATFCAIQGPGTPTIEDSWLPSDTYVFFCPQFSPTPQWTFGPPTFFHPTGRYPLDGTVRNTWGELAP